MRQYIKLIAKCDKVVILILAIADALNNNGCQHRSDYIYYKEMHLRVLRRLDTRRSFSTIIYKGDKFHDSLLAFPIYQAPSE